MMGIQERAVMPNLSKGGGEARTNNAFNAVHRTGSTKRKSFYGPTLLRVVEGSGSFMNFLSVQPPAQARTLRWQDPAVPQAPVELMAPFAESMAQDGTLRMCKLAEPDDWAGALDVLNAQVGMAGFRVTYTSSVKSGVSDSGCTLYIRKRVCCDCYRKDQYMPDGAVCRSSKTGCPVMGWLLNVTTPSNDVPGTTVPPGIYMQRVGDHAHNHGPDMSLLGLQSPRGAGRRGQLKRARDEHGDGGPLAKTNISVVRESAICNRCVELNFACFAGVPCKYCVQRCPCWPHCWQTVTFPGLPVHEVYGRQVYGCP